MIFSFHPNIVADHNILCAGRMPNDDDRAAISRAEAVILPQGPGEVLYRMCRRHCPHVFPNYDARFDYPGKLGQARLFQENAVPFPKTHVFNRVAEFRAKHQKTSPLDYPCVFKADWGGEGDEVFLIESDQALEAHLKRTEALEQSGHEGFLIQSYVPHGGQTLRVAVLGQRIISYWRRQKNDSAFLTSIKAGAVIDHDAAPERQEAGKAAVEGLCAKTGINLAGFDLLFHEKENNPAPLFLEINYFFGRRGLGGNERYYKLVDEAVARWLEGLGLCL